MSNKKTPEPKAKKMAVLIEGLLRKRLRRYVAEDESLTVKAVFNAALDEYLKKRGA